MKAKRISAVVAAAVITVSAFSASAFAFDYNSTKYSETGVPHSGGPSAPLVDNSTFSSPVVVEPDLDRIVDAKTVRESVKNDTPIRIPYDGVTVTKSGVAEIAKSDKPVTFSVDGAVVTIDPASVTEVKSEELKFRIVAAPEEGATYIYPSGSGAYPFAVEIKVPALKIPDTMDKANARLYHITDSAVEDQGAVSFAADGSCTVTLNSRSYFKITGSSAEDVSAAAPAFADGVEV